MDAAFYADFPALDVERFVQRDWFEVFDGHFFGQGNYVAQFVHFAHGVVEDGGDDAAVTMAGRAGVALAQAEFADEGLAGFIEGEFEAHTVGIILAAGETVVFLQLDVAGVVALGLGLAGHGGILTCAAAGRSNDQRSQRRRSGLSAITETPCQNGMAPAGKGSFDFGGASRSRSTACAQDDRVARRGPWTGRG